MSQNFKSGMHREPKWPLAGYAPGNYMGKCIICEETIIDVDKRAVHCLPCAIEESQKVMKAYGIERKRLTEENENLRAAIKIVST